MKMTRYIRYSAAGQTSYGILEDKTVRELRGDIIAGAEPTGKTLNLADVKLLAPCQPSLRRLRTPGTLLPLVL